MFLSTHATKENVTLKNTNREEYVTKCPVVTRAFIQSKLMVVLSVSQFFLKKKMKFLFIWMNKIFTENSPLKKPNPLDEISKNK